jgi:uncharacterized protein
MLKEKIEEVVKEQINNLELEINNIQREDLKKIKLINGFAIIISGIRRCGKSTLLKQLLKNEKKFYYINLEDIKLNNFELEDFIKLEEIFLENYGVGGTYFFDEIQVIPKWEKYIRGLADKKNKILITGSNASLLSRELGTLLTGRHISHELFPFTYKEYLEYTKQKSSKISVQKYIEEGGFPEYLQFKKTDNLQELFKDVLMRDVAIRFNIRNTNRLKKIAIYLITNVGKEVSYNQLKKMFSVPSIQTVIDYIGFFEDSYLLFTVPMFSYSPKKQQVYPKKIYSIDNGLSVANSLSFSKDKGRMLENIIFQHIRRQHDEIFYFKERNECDFLIKEKDKITQAIQVCYLLNGDNQKREIDGLIQALKETKLDKGIIITLDQEDVLEEQGKTIEIKPVWKWLLE